MPPFTKKNLPIRANMFESDTKKATWNLHWTHKTWRDEQA